MVRKLMVALLAAIAVGCAWADTETVGGHTWTYRINGGTAEVYKGEGSAAISPSPTGAVTIPGTLGGKPVTSIGYDAFAYCSDLTSVTIPNSVTSIGDKAFYCCRGLTSVTIPDSVTNIGYYAFSGCDGLTSVHIADIAKWCGISFADYSANPLLCAHNLYLNGEKVTDLVIPDSVTNIRYYAFCGCRGLTSVTIPNSVTIIGGMAFFDCGSLTSVTIPDSVTSIGNSAFSGCTGLTNVTIPDSVTSIGETAFRNCRSLTSVTIPNSVTNVGYGAFWDCSGLTSVTIPNSVTIIGGMAFYDCTNVVHLTAPCVLSGMDGSKLTSVTIPDSVTSIGNSAFSGCTGLTNVTIPDSVTDIGSYAFCNCGSLASVTIPDSVTSIGYGAFWGCSGLTSVTIPNSVTSIWYYAFYDCGSLSVLILGNPAIDGSAFSGVSAVYVTDAYTGFFTENMERLLSVTPPDDTVLEGPAKVTASCAMDGLVLRYTTDGSVPTVESPVFNPFTAKTAMTVKVGAFLDGELIDEKTVRIWEGAVSQPTLSVDGRLVQGRDRYWAFSGSMSHQVTIQSNTDGATIRYTLDGSEPTEESLVYTKPIDISLAVEDSVYFRSKAFKPGWMPSETEDITLVRLWTPGDSLGAPGQLFETGGRADWTLSQEGPDGGEALRSGKVADGTTSWFKTTVTGGGVVSFWWKTSCEKTDDAELPWDHVEFSVDGKRVAWLDGETDWVQVQYRIECDGEHLLRWTYVKDASDSAGEDCAWVSQFAWDGDSYAIVFHRNDASNEKMDAYEFDYGVDTRLPSLKSLGWARRGCDFLGWATSRANADAGKVWKKDWALVTSAAEEDATLDVYAVWALKPNSYAIEFIRNDGAGTWRTVGFNYGEKTRMPSLANGLGWARRGYDFKGWALTTADANAGKVWKGDWAYVATPVKAGEVLTVYAVWALKPGYYQIRFNKNDGSGRWRTLGFEYGTKTRLPTCVNGLGWTREGYEFAGWSLGAVNAAAGGVKWMKWKDDWAYVSTPTTAGRTISIYAIWE